MTTTPLTDQQLADAREYVTAGTGGTLADVPAEYKRYEAWLIEAHGHAAALLAELDRLRAELAGARAAAFSEAAALISSTSLARLEEIDEDDQRPSHWERHGEWCEAAALLLAALTAQAPR